MGPRGRHWSGASVIPLLVEQRQDDPELAGEPISKTGEHQTKERPCLKGGDGIPKADS